MSHKIISGPDSHKKIEEILKKLGSKKFMLVCDSSFPFLSIKDYFSEIDIPHIVFSEFTPNPLYEDVCKGVSLFNSENCDAIVAVGGGSTIDVAKCIKLYSKMDHSKNYLNQEYFDSKIPLIALPTTAGTGSESTRYAVIYFEGKKQSVAHPSIVPNYAVLEHSVLKTLPLYQKKCTMLDALCQAIESWWSVNSNDESKEYSKIAIKLIIENMDGYILENLSEAAEKIMLAANYAGRAINITQTTAAHAMSYKITSMFKLPHGYAVAVCLPNVWEFMLNHPEKCIDSRGSEYLLSTFEDISKSLKASSVSAAITDFRNILLGLQMDYPVSENREADLEVLTKSVNPVRLKNNPVELSEDTLHSLYERIVK